MVLFRSSVILLRAESMLCLSALIEALWWSLKLMVVEVV
jgi:hypothetical protein